MCIAIYKPAGKIIDRDTLHRCYLKNKDGCGFAYFKSDGELVILKSMSFNGFYEDYELHSVVNADRPFLIHFRIATHGTVDIYNCHPFQVDDNHVMIHNGIIHNVRKCPDKLRSDTQMFVDDILKELPEQWMFNSGITNLIEDYIGASKVVVLAADDSVTIYNEKKGEWSDDVWYSNGGYKEVTYKYSHRDDDYYGGRYGTYTPTKTTPHNYERPNIDPITGEKNGVLYGRWEYCNATGRTQWIEATREVKKTVDVTTPGSTWEKDENGEWGWVLVEESKDESKTSGEWKYNKENGMMEEFKDGVYTGACYIAGYQTKRKHLALVEHKVQEIEYETCCSCSQVLETNRLFVVDEFENVDDCFLCKRCIDEYNATGMPMSNPVSVRDIRKIEGEIQSVC
jgi:glutamine amidotransferase